MQPLATCPAGIARKAFEANSKLRWDWKQQQAYEVSDEAMYDSRFEHFKQFRSDFYAGLETSPLPRGNDGLVFIEYQSLGLVVAGFSSLHGE